MNSEGFESNEGNEPIISEDLQPKEQSISIKKSTFKGMIIGIIIVIGVAAFFAGSYISNFNSNQVSQEQLQDAISKLELKILQEQLSATQPTNPIKISADDDPVIGNINAEITIIEFSDFQCPFCERFNTQTFPLIFEEYIKHGKVKLVFRDFPIQSIHPNALPASVAAECANEQGKFKEMHDKLFDNQKKWNKQDTINALSIFNQYATEIELEQTKFESCLANGKYIDEIKNDLSEGQSYGVSGTPGFFIGNEKIGFIELKGAQPFDSFKKVIETQLEK
ncbi:MAG: hypothetical protein MAG458_01467 [Nitrosopumilus sp.]|nr:hypothetical protein [Nitrosopumilus sp.]